MYGQLMQMSMMATPNINKELHYLNREDRLLRWLLVKSRDTNYGLDFLGEEEGQRELSKLMQSSSLYEDEDLTDHDTNNDEEYTVDE